MRIVFFYSVSNSLWTCVEVFRASYSLFHEWSGLTAGGTAAENAVPEIRKYSIQLKSSAGIGLQPVCAFFFVKQSQQEEEPSQRPLQNKHEGRPCLLQVYFP